MATHTAERIAIGDPSRKYYVMIAALLTALIALLYAYFLLTKPPVSKFNTAQTDVKHVLSIYGSNGDLLRRPSGVGLDAQGNIYVADTGKQRIAVFDSKGTFVTQFGDPGEGKHKIKDPIGVTVAPDGRVFVLSKTLKKVVIYNSQYQPVHEIAFEVFPLSMAISDNKLYVTTVRGVMVGDLEGNLITTFGKRGQAPGDFQLPAGIVIDKKGTMYVADSLNYRVQALSKDGDPLWQYGKPLPPDKAMMYKDKDRKFGLPASIAADEDGHLYVVDGMNSEIVVLNTKGEVLETVGDIGHADGMFYYPDGIAYAGDGKLVLADKFNDRVQVFLTPFAASEPSALLAWLPYLLLLLPLLLLWALMRGRLQVIASDDFLQAAIDDGAIPDVKRAFKKLVVVPQTVEQIAGQLTEKLSLSQRRVRDGDIESIMSFEDLSDTQKATLALAKGTKGKRVVLTESAAVIKAATSLNITTMSYDEFKDACNKQAAGAQEPVAPAASAPEAAVPEAGEDA